MDSVPVAGKAAGSPTQVCRLVGQFEAEEGMEVQAVKLSLGAAFTETLY
jgi:hypothetical protein